MDSSSGDDVCANCHPMCRKCYGAALNQCTECTPGVPKSFPISGNECNCIRGYFYDSAMKNDIMQFCQPCHEFCTSCKDTKINCQSCISNVGVKLSPSSNCLCQSTGYFIYINETNYSFCVKCHKLCNKCSGPSPSQCSECNPLMNAYIELPSTCHCPHNKYYDTFTENCENCHPLCDQCYGSGNTKCSTCALMAKDVEKQSSICVLDCSSLGNYYTEDKSCKLCSQDCESCTYKTNKDCIKCSDKLMVQYSGTCIESCPIHYFALDRICYKCHESCYACQSSTFKGCTDCYDGYVLWQGQCLLDCPKGTYKLGKKKCEYCVPPCNECISAEQCSSCIEKYYFESKSSRCVVKEDCPDGTYGDDLSKYCLQCDISCATCFDKTAKSCKQCNFKQGYAKSEKNADECLELMCKEGTFRFIDFSQSLAWCAPCYFTCQMCDDYGAHSCITCGRKYRALPSNVTGRIFCQSCKDANSGYTESAVEGQGCIEICGDGKNLGQYACDDGNNMDGDGCSSGCQVEDGFACKTIDRSRPDICYDIKPPNAAAKVAQGQTLEITFDEKVVLGYDNNIMKNYLNISIENAESACGLTWSFKDRFFKKQVVESLTIKYSISCSLRGGGAEDFVIIVNDTEAFQDLTGNAMPYTIIRAAAMRFVYISPSTKDLMSGSGTAFTASAAITFRYNNSLF